MKRFTLGAVAALAVLGLYACSGDTTTTENVISCQPKYWNSTTPVQPPCTVPVSITVDDTANHAYLAGEIQWKGNFRYDEVTRLAFYDASWNSGDGPFAPLYDDGPWDQGGHEPLFMTSGTTQVASVAGDHKFGATMFVPVPAAAQSWEYGLVDRVFPTTATRPRDYGWIWRGTSNGTFTVPAGATAAIVATGQSFPAFGTTDVRLTLDTTALDAAFVASTADLTVPKVKGSGWAWSLIPMYDDGTHGDATAADHIFTFVLSNFVGAGNTYYHTGLAASGDVDQFVFTLGTTEKEYKVSGVPPTAGVAAATMPSGGSWTAATVANQAAGDKNTYITIP